MEISILNQHTTRGGQNKLQVTYKKEAHIAQPRNQSKSMNTLEASYDYLYVYYKINPVVQEEEIFIFRECILAILLSSPDVKRCCLSI